MRTTIKRCLQLGVALMLTWSTAQASTIVSTQSDVSLTTASTGDLLKLHAVNASGISYNEFSTFEVSGPTLKLMNLPTFDDQDNKVDPTRLIVIKANRIDINGAIEIAGAPADILFITNSSSGQINCNSCYIKGFSRATLATATSTNSLKDSMSSVGKLETTSSASININNLYAPGIYQLELITKNYNASGEIDINVAVDESRQPAVNGKLSLGAGDINVYQGAITFDYDSQNIADVDPTDTMQTVDENYYGVGINFTTSGQLNVTGKLNTKVDVLSLSAYKGIDRLPTETIKLQAFGSASISNVQNTTTKLAGTFQTAGDIIVRANNNLELVKGASKIVADYQEYAVTNNLYNYRSLFAMDMKIGALNVDNQGSVETALKLEIFAENNLVNRYGGELKGDVIQLESKGGFVRNGSRVPYVTEIASQEPFVYNSNHLTMGNDEILKFGTYYHTTNGAMTGIRTLDFTNPDSKTKATTHRAHILGRVVQIKSKSIENINPYWETVKAFYNNENEIGLEGKYINQVSIVAHESLKVDSKPEAHDSLYEPNSSYFLNSSAIVLVNGFSSIFEIDANYFINQRYRHLVYLTNELTEAGRNTSEVYGDPWGGGNIRTRTVTDTKSGNLRSRAYAYSPPGAIVAMGDLSSSTEFGFLNEASFIEVYANAKFYGGGVFDWGVVDSKVAYDDTIRDQTNYHYRYRSCGEQNDCEEGVVLQGTSKNDSRHAVTTVSDARNVPSLFLINGSLVEEGVDGLSKGLVSQTHFTWDGHVHEAARYIIENYDYNWQAGLSCEHKAYWECNKPAVVMDTSTSSATDTTVNDVLNINIDLYVMWNTAWGELPDGVAPTSGRDSQEISESYNLLDVMMEYVDRAVSAIQEFYNEFKWWD